MQNAKCKMQNANYSSWDVPSRINCILHLPTPAAARIAVQFVIRRGPLATAFSV
jgi:hypothetical protein